MSVENDKYQEVTIAIIVSAIVFWVLVGCIIYFVIQYQRRRFQHAKEKADLQSAFEKNLLQSKIEIQEQAFNEISRELHDNIGQQLSLAKLNLNTLKEVALQDEEKINDTRDLIGSSIEQLRDIARTLLGEKVSSMGLVAAVRAEVARIQKMELLDISLTASESSLTLSAQHEIILFRIIQEALNNVVKHAEASKLSIKINSEKSILAILIQDNGKGFKLVADSNAGLGLLNMKNRAQTIGADLSIDSAPHQGTGVKIIVKMPTDN